MGGRASRLAVSLLSALLLLAGAAALAWWTVVPRIAARYALAQLQQLGIPASGLTVDRLWLSGARLSAITIGDSAATIDRVDLGIDLLRLWREQRIDSVTVTGATLHLALGADGSLVLPGIALGDGRGGEATVPAVPLDRLTLLDSRVLLATPYGELAAPLTLTATQRVDGGLSLSGEVMLRHDSGTAAADLEADVAADGSLTGTIDLREGRLSRDALVAEGVSGWASFAGSLAGLRDVAGEVLVGRLLAGPVALDAVSLQFAGPGLPEWTSLRATASDGALQVAADAAFGGWSTAPAAALQATVRADDLAALSGLAGADLGLSGRGSLDLALDAPLARLLAGDLAGEVTLALNGAAVEGLATGVSATIAGRLALDDGGATLTATAPWSLAGVVTALGDDARLQLAEGTRLAGRWTAAGWDVDLTTDLDVESAGNRASLQGNISFSGAPFAATSWLLDQAVLRLAPVDAGDGLMLAADGLRLSGGGGFDTLALAVAGPVSVAGTVGGVAIGQAAADLRGVVTRVAGAITYSAEGCQPVAIDSAAIGETRLGAPLLACLGEGAGPLFRLDEASGDWDMALAVPSVPASLDLSSGDGIDLLLSDLAAQGSADGWRLAFVDGALDWPGVGLAASGIGGTAATDAAGLHADLAADRLSLPGDAVGPLAVAVTLDTAEDGVLAFHGEGRGGGGALRADFDGSHDLAANTGGLTFRAAPVTFADGGLQPADILPIARGWPIDKVAGQVAVEGSVRWGDGGGTAATVRLSDLGLRIGGGVAVLGVSGSIRLSSLAPLRAPAGQRVTAAVVDVGLVLENAVAEFGIGRGDRVEVARLDAEWAGGRLSADPFGVSLAAPQLAATLRAEGIDLGTLARDLDIDGLSLTGRIAGAIPIRQEGDAFRIDDAELVATAPGIISYRPEDAGAGLAAASDAAPGGGLDLLMSALEQFHYRDLSVTLDGRTGQDLQIGLKVNGANPDLYDGYPVALNVSLSGALDQILRRTLATTRYADQLQQMFLDEMAP